MFERAVIKKSGNLKSNFGMLYTEWKGRLHRTRSNQNNEFIIILSESKRGIHHIDRHKYAMRGYQIHLVFPGQRSHFSVLDSTIVYQLRMTKTTFEKICFALRFNLKLYKGDPVRHLTQMEFDKVCYELKQIGNELHLHRPLLEIVSSRVRIILQEISKILEKQISDNKLLGIPIVLFKFFQLLEQQYHKERSVGFYAQKLNITSSHLATLTRRHLEISPLKIINIYVLAESMRLLSLVPTRIKSVMHELGFVDQVAFNHFFKGLTGMSPREFQKVNTSLPKQKDSSCLQNQSLWKYFPTHIAKISSSI